jgi:hypothetical protein
MSSPPYPLLPQPKKKSWLERDTGWKIALICLICVGLLAIFIAAIFAIVSYSFHHSFVFNEAIARAERNPQVVSRIGTPLKPGWLPMGKIEVSGSTGRAHLEIPVTGPRGKATMRLDAHKVEGTWQFDTLEIEFEEESRWINLLDQGGNSQTQP